MSQIFKKLFGGSGTFLVPQVTSDPVPTVTNSAWILVTAGGPGGKAKVFLGFWVTQPTGATTYQLSYAAYNGDTVRTSLTAAEAGH